MAEFRINADLAINDVKSVNLCSLEQTPEVQLFLDFQIGNSEQTFNLGDRRKMLVRN